MRGLPQRTLPHFVSFRVCFASEPVVVLFVFVDRGPLVRARSGRVELDRNLTH